MCPLLAEAEAALYGNMATEKVMMDNVILQRGSAVRKNVMESLDYNLSSVIQDRKPTGSRESKIHVRFKI